MKYIWPNTTTYISNDCTGTYTSGRISDTCTPNGADNDEVSNDAYSKYIFVSNLALHSIHMEVVTILSVILVLTTLL